MNTDIREELAELTDEELVLRVQSGEDQIFDVLSDRYREKLARYVLKYVHESDAAEDVMQTTFIKAHKNIDSFDVVRTFSPWIYRIAHNEAVSYITAKNKKNHVSLDDEDSLSVSDQATLADVESASMEKWFHEELREEMAHAISQLPDKYADIIHMRFIEDLSYGEISEKIGKPVNTVGTLVRRAKKQLLKIMLDDEL